MKSQKLVVIVDEKSHFSREDAALLRQDFDVVPVYLDLTGKEFLTMFSIGITRIIPGIFTSDISITWFADYHAAFVVFFSRLFRKKSIVLVGGHEVCTMPDIRYGYQRLFFRGFIVRWILRNATQVVVPSRSYADKVRDLVNADSQVIPMSSEPDANALREEKTGSVAMVANQYLGRGDYISLKGIATYDKIAENLHEVPCYLIGRTDPEIKTMFLHLRYPGEMNHDALLKFLATSKVYCQLSYTESFGVSLLEALQSGCVPVVTDKDGMKELVGDHGYNVPYGDAGSAADAVRKALDSQEDRTGIAHYYQATYSPERRRTAFRELIASVYATPSKG